MLILIIGTYGSGKTLLQTILAFIGAKAGKNIVSNYKLKEIEYSEFNTEVLFESELNDVDLFLDEIYSLIDARGGNTKYARLMSYILFQSRKRNVNIIGSAQLSRTIDVRYREMYDMIIYCEQSKDKSFRYTLYNRKNTIRFKLSFRAAKKFFSNYDTNQIITSKPMNALLDEFRPIESTQDLAAEKLNEFIEFMSEYNQKKPTQDFIQFYCESKKLPCIRSFYSALKFAYKQKMYEAVEN